ncbi:hypothetical protein AOLI_G00162480 [Acnodon oligacanthus]
MDSQATEGSHLTKPYSYTCPKLRDANVCALARTDVQVHKQSRLTQSPEHTSKAGPPGLVLTIFNYRDIMLMKPSSRAMISLEFSPQGKCWMER